MLHKSRAILLHHFRYAEKSIILKVFTLEDGLQSFILYRPSNKNKTQGALEPLSLLEIVSNKQEKKELQQVREIHVEHPYARIGRSFLHNTVVLFVNEILIKCIKDEQPNEELFYFVWEWLISFDHNEFESDAHLFFLAQLTRFFGIFPDCKISPERPYFSLTEGKCISQLSNNPRILELEQAQAFLSLFTLDQEHTINRSMRKQLLNNLIEYYFLHIPAFGELKSLPVLEELME